MNMSNDQVDQIGKNAGTCDNCSRPVLVPFTFVYAHVKSEALVRHVANEQLCADCAQKYSKKIELFLATESHMVKHNGLEQSDAEAGQTEPPPSIARANEAAGPSNLPPGKTPVDAEPEREPFTFEEWLQRLGKAKSEVRIVDKNNFVHEGTVMLIDRKGLVIKKNNEEIFFPYEFISSLVKSRPRG